MPHVFGPQKKSPIGLSGGRYDWSFCDRGRRQLCGLSTSELCLRSFDRAECFAQGSRGSLGFFAVYQLSLENLILKGREDLVFFDLEAGERSSEFPSYDAHHLFALQHGSERVFAGRLLLLKNSGHGTGCESFAAKIAEAIQKLGVSRCCL